MKTVYVPIGPRAAGKSTACTDVRKNKPHYKIISRDGLLDRFFGGVHQDPYNGAHNSAVAVVKRLLQRALDRGREHIILDTWTEEDMERVQLIQSIKELGADRVVAIYFTTPAETVDNWFWQKPRVAKLSTRPKGVIDPLTITEETSESLTYFPDNAPLRGYTVFHRFAAQIDSNGFDEVIRFNPLEQRLHEII